jgi:hypothetical protein
VTMILQECVFGQGAFWGWLAALQRWPVLFQSMKIRIGIFYVEKGARLNLNANSLEL